jgi:hypothetical protein
MIFTADNGFRDLGLGYNAAGLNRMNARFRVFMEPFHEELAGSDVLQDGQQKNIIGLVSRGSLKLMCDAPGFSCEFLKWDAANFDSQANLKDYLRENPGGRQRYSVVLRPLKR